MTSESGADTKKILFYDYDTQHTLIEKYSIQMPGSIPQFFRIDPITKLNNNVKIIVYDVRTEFIEKYNIEQLIQNSGRILSLYNLDRRILGFLYLSLGKEYQEQLKELDSFMFSTKKLAGERLDQWKKGIEKEREILETRFKQDKKIGDELNTVASFLDQEPMIYIDETLTKFYLNTKAELIVMFDNIVPSSIIPFIIIKYDGRTSIKTCTSVIPDQSWITGILDSTVFDYGSENAIYMFVLSIPASQISSKQILNKNKYVKAIITNNKVLEIPYISPKKDILTEQDMINRVFNSIKFKFKVERQVKTNIKCNFTLDNILIDRVIFSDLVETNPLISTFIFFDEEEFSVLKKERLSAYYYPHQEGEIENSIGLIITPKEKDSKSFIKIRMTRVQDHIQMNSCVQTLLKLLEIYQEEIIAGSLQDIYAPYMQANKKVKIAKATHYDKKIKDKKLDLLKEYEPEMFGSTNDYAKTCPANQQPTLLVDDDQKKIVEQEMKKAKLSKDDIKNYILAYGNKYSTEVRNYTCWGNKDYPYIGVRNYSKKPKSRPPFVPCCFKKEDTYKITEKRLQMEKQEQEGKVVDVKQTNVKYIVGPHHLAPKDRRGDLPINWLHFLEFLEIDKINISGKERYPFFRYGVELSPSSFILCMEKVYNKQYNFTPENKMISTVRKYLIDNYDTLEPFAKQELCVLNKQEILNILQDDSRYFDPLLFVSMMEQKYKCNIYLFTSDAEHPESEITVPYHKQAYLFRKPYNESIVIFLYPSNINFLFQCELLAEEKQGFIFKFSGKMSDKLESMMLQHEQIYITDFSNMDNGILSLYS